MRGSYSYHNHRPRPPPPDFPRNHRPHPPPRPQCSSLFTIALFPPRQRSLPAGDPFKDVATLISSLPSAPVGPVTGGRLHFCCRADAIAVLSHLWSLRLRGSHDFRVRLFPATSSDCDDVDAALKPVFADHARRLFRDSENCDVVDKLAAEIRIVSSLLRDRNRYQVFIHLEQKKKELEKEKNLAEAKWDEFRAAMRCILRHLGNDVVVAEEKDADVEVIKFGGKFDWERIYRVMEREQKRFDMSLPIYGHRTDILKKIACNQVIVLIGETGSGKSTQLVQFLVDSDLGTEGSIICTQPRKVAAMSLAQRVVEESNGCYGDIGVTCCPTYSSLRSSTSKVIFTTDHSLLQHCMNNKSMSGISYVIVDEAHERSLNTDLLLALIKKKLLERFDLRLIIMSATVDANKLSEYFYGCLTLHVIGRTFPVITKYVADANTEGFAIPSLKGIAGKCAQHVSDVLKMVSVIHKTEKDGAILAFLTSQVEVEFACENFNHNAAIVLPMHGKLTCDEQHRVFKNYPGKRKIVFATNIAETSLTIPDVKYVVDSGMAKDMKFDPSTGMNVLKVCQISQSSANQRAGRAGRTESGKCYRLYSEYEFQNMQVHQEPEIRKVHLGIAVLRILALGIKNIHEFDFVDAPSPKAIDKAVQNLIYIGAIVRCNDECVFTDMGHRLVKLGIEPRLGKIILECFNIGLSKEGVVLAALMANASSIFCRIGSEEEKNRADCLKLPFCHHDGDLFTLLSVYKKWEDEHMNKNKWCWENSINAKSMRRCRETISELEYCLEHELNMIIPSYWRWNPLKPSELDKSLKKAILSSLLENVAMYSGYDRLGFEVALTGKHLQLHPSCSLLAFSKKPCWVVFGEILSISNEYMVCVTVVDYGCLYSIQPPIFDISELESRKMEMNVISGVCTTVLKRLCGKTNSNLHSIIRRIRDMCMDNRVGIDVDFDKREVQYFAPAKDMQSISFIINSILQFETRWLKDECFEKCLYHGRQVGSSCMALFGSGAEIKHLELEKRCLSVEICHPGAATLDEKELLMFIDRHAPGVAHYYRHVGGLQNEADNSRWARLTYLNPEAAETAVLKLNGVEFQGAILKVEPAVIVDHKPLAFSGLRVKVSWPRRPSKGVALVSCSMEDADSIIKDCCALVVGGTYVNCEISTKYKNCLFVTGIPKDVSEQELYDAFRSRTKRKIYDVNVLRGEPLDTLSPAACAEVLSKEIAPFMSNKQIPYQNFRVEVFSPEPKDYMMKATIAFDGSLHLEAAKALDHIQGKTLPGFQPWQKVHCQHTFYSSLSCPARIYDVIRVQLNSILHNFKQQKGVLYTIERNESGSFRIKICANATKTIADLRKPLEQLMKGRLVSDPNLNSTVLQLLWSRDGTTLVKSLERETGTHIFYDKQNLSIKLFGPPKEIIIAEKKLVESLLSLQENKKLEIRLRGRNFPPDLMKEVVKKFNPDLSKLKESVPGVEVVLDIRRHILCVMGSKESKQKVQGMISELLESLDRSSMLITSGEASCPICLCELEEPYKLELCSHDFCRACLLDQCESAIRSRDGFPLLCAKEGCKSPLLLVDLKLLLSADKLQELFRASLGAFVAANMGKYRFCPTPDCPGIYKVTSLSEWVPPDLSRPYVCGACGTETCTRCHLEYHPFISCEKYKEYKEDPDQSLVEWRKGKEHVKDCPSCNRPIEKIDGCNHIGCRCGAHVCWVCLEWFMSSDDCYGHLRIAHGAII